MKKIYLLFIIFVNATLVFAQNEIKNIFDPNNLNSSKETNTSAEVTKDFDFTLYGIIDTGKVKKAIIRPKSFLRGSQDKLDKHNYVILKVGESYQNIKLISIDNNTAKFKKGENIYSIRVFQNKKNDRISIRKKESPTIINVNKPVKHKIPKINKKSIYKNNKNLREKKIKREHIKKRKIENKKSVNNKNNPRTNPFLEILKRSQKQNNSPSTPATNPFLQLLQQQRRK